MELEIARRNARFRAFRAIGVPVDAAWVPSPSGPILFISCSRCDTSPRGFRNAPSVRGSLAESEAFFIRLLFRRRCWCLAPLLEADPPELEAIYELELLAG